MQRGDLRRFKTPIRFSHDARRVSGHAFLVVDIPEGGLGHKVDMLVNGHLERGWDWVWVLENSEAISEVG